MARKIGFSKPDTEPKKSIADSYLDEFRKRHNHKHSPDPHAPVKRRRNWLVIAFLSLWLTLWSFGILMVTTIVLSGGAEVFLLIWLTFAIIGWFIAAAILRVQIKGKPVDE